MPQQSPPGLLPVPPRQPAREPMGGQALPRRRQPGPRPPARRPHPGPSLALRDLALLAGRHRLPAQPPPRPATPAAVRPGETPRTELDLEQLRRWRLDEGLTLDEIATRAGRSATCPTVRRSSTYSRRSTAGSS